MRQTSSSDGTHIYKRPSERNRIEAGSKGIPVYGPWPIHPVDDAAAEEASLRIARKMNVHPLAARVLVNRGIGDPAAAEDFLNPRLDRLHDPNLMPGMEQAVARILTARHRGEKVRIYGDYDVDGVCGVVMLLEFFRGLGIETDYYIPHRLDEGYGLHAEAAAAAAAAGVTLMVTVDTGISDGEGVAAAREAGIDVIITDHHDPPDALPPAAAIVHPFLPGSAYPFPFLAGAGVALKLVAAVASAVGPAAGRWTEYLDLAALATMADVVPLTGENRILAYFGLKHLRSNPRPGIAALCREARLEPRVLSSSDVTFMLAPRLNAAGRIHHARTAVELLLASEREAPARARMLEEANSTRRDIQDAILEEIYAHLGEAGGPEPGGREMVFLGRPHWHPGVLGIAAGRLAEELGVPVLLAQIDGDRWRGSGRTAPGFDLIAALRRCDHLLESYGGHARAAGFTLGADAVDEFRRELGGIIANFISEPTGTGAADVGGGGPEIPAQHDGDGGEVIGDAGADGGAGASKTSDAVMAVADVSSRLVADLARLEPFGEGNPPPLFTARLPVVRARTVGGGGEHLKLELARGLDGIAFRRGSMLPRVVETGEVFALFTPEFNYWRGRRELQLRIEDLETEGLPLPASAEPGPGAVHFHLGLLDRDMLGSLYRCIRGLARSGGRRSVPGREIHRAVRGNGFGPASERLVGLGLRVFTELGIVEPLGGPSSGKGAGHRLDDTVWRFVPPHGTVNLGDSPTFRKYGSE